MAKKTPEHVTPETALAGISTRLIRVDPRSLKLLKLNARFMKQETYRQLVANIKRDGVLTSVPFAWKDETGEWEVLSGNHRATAAIDAGIKEIDLMVTDDRLTRQQRVAIQLSHNALEGEDDPATLKELYGELEDVDWRAYAALDDKALGLLDNVKVDSLGEANLDYSTVTLVFLPHELAKARAALQDAKTLSGATEMWMAPMPLYDATLDALEVIGQRLDVRNVATAFIALLSLWDRHGDEIGDTRVTEGDTP